MIEIKLTGKRSGVVLIDDEFEHLTKYKWRINSRGYVHANLPRNGAKVQKQIVLHHAVIGKPKRGMVVDHINHNKLDNRMDNLRHCTHSQNQMNRMVTMTNKVGLKGVSPARNKFRACIWLNGKSIKLGTFNTPEEAHQAYLYRAKKEYKEYAYA